MIKIDKKEPKNLEQERVDDITLPENKHLNEAEIRALLKSELANYRGIIRVRSGKLSSGGTELSSSGLLIGGTAPGTEVSLLDWSNTLTFSAVDHDTVEWNSGVITLSDGTIYNITAGNTGDMSTVTYIYLDVAVSETTLQTTIDANDAVGNGKILVGVADNNADTTSDAKFKKFGGGPLDDLLTADNLASNTITANEIAANTVTAAEIGVTQLSSISANIGTITAGTITGVDVTAKGGGSGVDVRLNSTTGRLEFLDGNDVAGYAELDEGTQDVTINADNNLVLEGDGVKIEYDDDDKGTPDCEWFSNGSLRMKLDQDGNLSIDGSYSDGGAGFCERFDSLEPLEAGETVTTEGDNIRRCKEGEEPIGVIPFNPAFIGRRDIEGPAVSFLGREWVKKGEVIGKSWVKLKEDNNLIEYLVR
jgi:hypothetical protein